MQQDVNDLFRDLLATLLVDNVEINEVRGVAGALGAVPWPVLTLSRSSSSSGSSSGSSSSSSSSSGSNSSGSSNNSSSNNSSSSSSSSSSNSANTEYRHRQWNRSYDSETRILNEVEQRTRTYTMEGTYKKQKKKKRTKKGLERNKKESVSESEKSESESESEESETEMARKTQRKLHSEQEEGNIINRGRRILESRGAITFSELNRALLCSSYNGKDAAHLADWMRRDRAILVGMDSSASIHLGDASIAHTEAVETVHSYPNWGYFVMDLLGNSSLLPSLHSLTGGARSATDLTTTAYSTTSATSTTSSPSCTAGDTAPLMFAQIIPLPLDDTRLGSGTVVQWGCMYTIIATYVYDRFMSTYLYVRSHTG